MRQKMKQLLGILLSLVTVLGLMPGMSLTALAYDGNPYASLVNTTTTVTFNDKPWYIIADNSTAVDAGTVTLLAADTSFGLSAFSDSYSNDYSNSKVKASLDALTTSGSFKDVADAIETNTDAGGKLYLLSTSEAQQLSRDVLKMNFSSDMGGWWLRSPGMYGDEAEFVHGEYGHVDNYGFYVREEFGVRPALKLNLSSVIFSSESKSFTLKPAHTHSFTYSASGEIITATCGVANCTLTDSKATLSIAAPTITTYGGTGDATATLTGLDAFNTATGKSIAATEIKYVGRDSTTYAESTTAPTGAGDYKASITVGGATASVEYTIAQADSTANAPTGLTATYGQTLANVSLEGKNPEGNTPGTWAWANSTQSVGDVVTPAATFKANFTPTSSNYKTVENVDVTVTVGKAANPATVTGTATVIKGGNAVDLANNVTKNGATGDVGYAIDGEAKGCTLNGSVLTSGDTTGTVTVNVTVATDSNYEALAATPITVTISDKGTQTITASDVTATYGDTDKKVNASVTDPATGGGAISYAVKTGCEDYIGVDATTGALTIKKVPADGKAYVTVTAAGTATYEQATKDVTVTINKADPTVTAPTAKTLTYTGSAQELVNAGSTNDGELRYAVTTENTAPTDDNLYTTTIPKKTDAGTYHVWYKVVGDAGHEGVGPERVDATIAPRPVTVTADAKSSVYGAKVAKLTFAVTAGSLVEGDEISSLGVKASSKATSSSKVGSYAIALAGGEANANYAVTLEGATYKVTKASMTVTAKGFSGTYDGKAHGITVKASPKSAGATVWYATKRLTAKNYRTAGSTNPVIRTDVGTTTVYWYVEAANYVPVSGSATVTVRPVAVPSATVTAHVQGKGDVRASGGATAGTTGQSLRMEAMSIVLPATGVTGGIEYRAHLQGGGWEKSWSRDGALSGTKGQSRRMEAVQVRLYGEMKATYDVYYRVHVQGYGWMAWAKNGENAGTTGMSRRMEAVQVVLVRKGATAPAKSFKGATQNYAKAFALK